MTAAIFAKAFRDLTGVAPFPWQHELFRRLIDGDIPSCANLPTGLGKTSVVAVWLCALAWRPERVPRRLVYVVNRRTIVDQTTTEIIRWRDALRAAGLHTALEKLCAVPLKQEDTPVAVSTLRGQLADNREWCTDPARPAVIVGTVDMIGSGLLFSRYTCGFKARPHHAAFLGEDVLIVHDEAHLEPAFQELLTTIEKEQARCGDLRPGRVLELSATSRGDRADSFGLTADDEKHPIVRRRLDAAKHLRFHPIANEKELPETLIALALARRDSGHAVLVFVRTVEAAQRVAAELRKHQPHTETLTGTMRGRERDRLAESNPTFLRFLPPSSRPKNAPAPATGTAYLVATSAGEVGVNLSAEDLVCDLSTYESIAQRFGRVNRFGEISDATIDLVHPEKFDSDDRYDVARERTLALLRKLGGNASPQALRTLDPAERQEAFSPSPELRLATDILFDSWALTTIRDRLPGRPPVAPYLHGEPRDWEPPETYVAWREEVSVIGKDLRNFYDPEELLADYPLKPHELLRDRSARVRERLAALAEQPDKAELLVWLITGGDSVQVLSLSAVADKDQETRLHDALLLLPPEAGGLSPNGLLEPKSPSTEPEAYAVADLTDSDGKILRTRVWSESPIAPEKQVGLRLVRVIDTLRHVDDPDTVEEPPSRPRYWLWFEAPFNAGTEGKRAVNSSVPLEDHTRDVTAHARAIVQKLSLPARLAHCVVLAARFHDLGKRRRSWQRSIGNFSADCWLAKAGRELGVREFAEHYRHEFGSLLDAPKDAGFAKLSEDERDLVLHLIAAHHGRARPHFPAEEAFDPEAAQSDAAAAALEVPRRFARLQRRYGRWGLAYLESLLRAADYAASAGIPGAKEDAP